MLKKNLYLLLLSFLYINKASALVSYKDNNYIQSSSSGSSGINNFFNMNYSTFSGFSPLLIILNIIATVFLYLIIAKAVKSYVSYQCAHTVIAVDKRIAKNIIYIVLMFLYCLLILRINFNYL
jgi:hypothetical protein